jgi:hypothetical protein
MSGQGRFFTLDPRRKSDIPAHLAHFHQPNIPNGDYESMFSVAVHAAFEPGETGSCLRVTGWFG